MDVDVQESYHLQFVHFLITFNNAFNVYRNKEFEIFIRSITSNYNLPSRRVVLDDYYKNDREYLLKLKKHLKYVNDVTITMNKWEYVSNNSIYTVMNITNLKQWILDIVHFT